jgi:DNA primase
MQQDAKEEVRARLNIEDVIGQYVRLQRAGKDLKGLSPFTSEKTPSFMVSPDKHVWYDFSSNTGGDIFNFIMKVEGLDFRGALELLAQKAGVDLSQYGSGDKKLAERKKRLYELLNIAATYYQQTFLKNHRALEYVFKTRKLSKEIVQEFQIGYAPDTSSSAVDFLSKKGFSEREIKDAGMTNRRGGDLFRSRIMIPLMDSEGKIIGFTGRLLDDDSLSSGKAPKYLNTPQTLLYDKSRHVFGLSQAKEAIRKTERAVMVEGNLDVIASHQTGVKQVVAAAGTAMTEQHLKMVKRFSSHILLAFDGDRAGVAATERAITLSQSLDIQLEVITLPDDTKDPDELIQKNDQLWSEAISRGTPAVEWLLSVYQNRYDVTTGDGKKRFTSASLRLLHRLRDEVEQEHYVHTIAKVAGVSVETLVRKLSGIEPEHTSESLRPSKTTLEPQAELYPHQDALLGLMLLDPKTRVLLTDIQTNVIESEDAQKVCSYLLTHPDKVFSHAVPKALKEVETYVKIILLKADDRYGAWSDLDRYDETARLIKLMKRETSNTQKARLLQQLRDAEAAGDDTAAHRLQTQLNELIKEMK